VSRAIVAALLALVVGAGAGCRVAYIPGEQRVPVEGTDASSLRKLVRVRVSACTTREARGVVRSRADARLRVTVAVTWDGAEATTAVTAAPGGETPITVPAPPGASADVGCQAQAQEVSAVR
jgi:hypothetical protein